MRKWLLLLFLFLVLLVVGVYVLIPNRMTLKKDVQVKVANKAFQRTILDENLWKQWWPGETVVNSSGRAGYQFVFRGNRYTVLGKQMSSHAIEIDMDEGVLYSQLLFLPANDGSMTISWQAAPGLSANPFQRFRRYRSMKSLEQDWQLILDKLKTFYAAEENLYGLPVREEFVKDSDLISTSIQVQTAPLPDTIYALIDQLKSYAKKNGATPTDHPMLNITRMIDTDQPAYYRVQVALPVDKKLPGEGKILYKWMLAGGNILAAEIKGGPHTIQKGFDILEKYSEEHNRIAPAMPFQSLVTDRRLEPDTNKWITKIYWPVM